MNERLVVSEFGERLVEMVQQPPVLVVLSGTPEPLGVVLEPLPLD